ncbi:MAG: fructosamine kinase family protein [Candidatus Promineifilaceae bacterium]
MNIHRKVEQALGQAVVAMSPLTGGSVGQVYSLRTADGQRFVVKIDLSAGAQLDIEAFMLDYLREHSQLPVPEPVYCDPELLVMRFVPGVSVFSTLAQQDAADKLAELHSNSAPRFGLQRDTLIGSLHQPNAWRTSWVHFFVEQRLLYMTEVAANAGRLPVELARRLGKLAPRAEDLLLEPGEPALLHGDIWTTNVLARADLITGFLDPAIYYGSPEIELAFITLFNTFGQPFFDRYQERHPLERGFFKERRHIYNLYPLLVHVRLFGGGYVLQVRETLERFGC